MGTIIQENEMENLKMKVIGLKNEIPYPMWHDFIEWLIEEVDYYEGKNEDYAS